MVLDTAVLVIVVITALIENESGAWATLLSIAVVVVASIIFKFSILAAIKLHPGLFLTYIAGYLVIGIAWSLAKWYLFLRKKLVEYRTDKALFMKKIGVTFLSPEENSKFMTGYYEIPTAANHKSDLIRWVSYWPFSVLGTLLHDFVYNLYEHIYGYLQGTYQRISDMMFKEVKKDADAAREYRNTTKGK